MKLESHKDYYWPHFITMLDDVTARLNHGERPSVIQTNFGYHGIRYGTDDTGQYAVVGFEFPAGIYAEIEDGTYGTLQGLRIYYQD